VSQNKTLIPRRTFLKRAGLAGLGLGAAAAGAKLDLFPKGTEAAVITNPDGGSSPAVNSPVKTDLGAAINIGSSKIKTAYTPFNGHHPTNEERLAAANAAKVARAQAAANGIKTLSPNAVGVLAVPDYFGPFGNFAYSPLPIINGSGQVTPGSGMRKFVDGLPQLTAAGANNLGQYMSIATPDTLTYPGSDYYEIACIQTTIQMHSDLPPTTVRGYIQTNNGTTAGANTVAPAPYQHVGPLIVAHKDVPVRIRLTNLLPVATHFYPPADASIMGAGTGPLGGTEVYPDNRVTIHLHGGLTPWISDGTPHQWTAPNLSTTSYPKGASAQDVPDMPVSPNGTLTFYYTNHQSARLMFYHDHALGITRINVYMGVAAGYLLTDPAEQAMIAGTTIPGSSPAVTPAVNTLPGLGIPLVIQDKTFVPPPAQLALEDPTWDTAAWGPTGSFWYQHVYMPNQNPFSTAGVTPMGRWDYGPWFGIPGILNGPVANPLYVAGGTEPPQNPGVPNVSVVGETFFDTPVINGTAYPTLTVPPQPARFRILSAGDDRFWNLSLFKATPLTVSVTASGSGYTSVPTVGITGGSVTGATATALLGVVIVNMVALGSGYSSASPPAVTITANPVGSGGYGATAAAVVTPSGTISNILVLTAGTGYLVPPTVTIAAPTGVGGLQASATAVLGLVGLNLTNPGVASSGAIINPTITITGGGGVGAGAIGSVLSDVAMVPAVPNPALPFPNDWVIPTDGVNVISSDILDGRVGGVPDPRAIGPSWIQVGNEGGFLPQVAVIPPMPIGYQHNNKNATWNNVSKKSLYLAPAERADVIVDFSAYAGQTLILYSDSPAPVPLFDVRNDNFTNDPDYTPAGGAPTTLAGYGPNTRTLMQIRVSSVAPTIPPVNMTALSTAIMAAYKTTQDPPLVPQSVYNAALGTSYPDDYVTIRDTEFSPAAAGTSVASAVVVARGAGYITTAPSVTFSGGGGTGAIGTVNIAPLGSITGFLLGVGGSGYTSAPTVVLTGGGFTTAATARAVVTAGAVVRVDVLTAGAGYTAPPTVTFTGGGGTGAIFAAAIGEAFLITAPGGSYTLPPVVALSAATTGTTPTVVSSLGVASVTLVTPGTYNGYTTPPIVTVTGGGGTGAVLVPVMALNPIPGALGGGSTVASVTVVDPGGNYTTIPTLAFSGGPVGAVQATATAVLGVGILRVTSATAFTYTAPPTVTITNAAGDITGAGATATAINNTLTTGIIGTVTIPPGGGGTGYTTAPQVTFTGGMGATGTTGYATLTGTLNFHMQPKDVVPGFERYFGRLSMQEGANLTPFYYVDPATEIWGDSITPGVPATGDSTQIWLINPGLGVDSHPLHWHLFNLQVINRIGTDGVIRPPDPNEVGLREVVRINPFELLVIAARPYAPQTPFGLPLSSRPLSPSEPIGATMSFTNLLPGGGVTSVSNQVTNFGYEYVWHCHILSHEENDMMRPVIFQVVTALPTAPTLAAIALAGGNTLTWSDPTPAATSMGNTRNEVGFNILRAGSTGTLVAIAKVPANTTTWKDGTALAGTIYRYQVNAFNASGTGPNSNLVSASTTTALALPTIPVLSTPAASAAFAANVMIPFSWAAATGALSYTFQILSGASVVIKMPGLLLTTVNLPNGILPAGAYTWQVSATNNRGTSTLAVARAFTVTAPVAVAPVAPVLVSPANASSVLSSRIIALNWGAVPNATSYNLVVLNGVTTVINVTGIPVADYNIPAGTLTGGKTYTWNVTAVGPGGTSPASASFTFTTRLIVFGDFDGDGKKDLAFYDPALGQWQILQSGTSTTRIQSFGFPGARIVPGDYDGDGKADIAVYDPPSGQWFIWQSSTSTMRTQIFGFPGAICVPGDYDGDGKTDIALYDPANGNWFILQSSTGTMRTQNFGFAGAIPVPADYDGDGKTDLAVYDPSGHGWFVMQSSTNTMVSQNWGFTGAVPVPGDYDGDGKADYAVYDPSGHGWFIFQSSTSSMFTMNFGFTGAVLVPGDYDGDGKTDLGVYDTTTGGWFIFQSSTSTTVNPFFGVPGAIPVP
jgi:FtsP/CotA-like multicopper oxidase with cupredoxin domain